MNNVNWLFYDVDRNQDYKDPNKNQFMNVVNDKRTPAPGPAARRESNEAFTEYLPTQLSSIAKSGKAPKLLAGAGIYAHQ